MPSILVHLRHRQGRWISLPLPWSSDQLRRRCWWSRATRDRARRAINGVKLQQNHRFEVVVFLRTLEVVPVLEFGQPARPARRLARLAAGAGRAIPLVPQVPRGPGGTTCRSSGTCVVFASSSAGILQPPMMRTSTPERDLGRRRAEENEETVTGSFSKQTPLKKTGSSDRWNQYTFRSVMARREWC